jgi:hypothetical protein
MKLEEFKAGLNTEAVEQRELLTAENRRLKEENERLKQENERLTRDYIEFAAYAEKMLNEFRALKSVHSLAVSILTGAAQVVTGYVDDVVTYIK